MASSPVVILLDRGNISDSLLILLLVLAADATIRACRSGQLRSLLWAGVLVGFAFQAKMLQAWLVVPALFLAYLVAAPAASFLRRVWHLAAATLAVAVVSLSWMSAVSLVPQSSRPYVDGSCNDSLFIQVFSYNGFSRLGGNGLDAAGCNHTSIYLITDAVYSARHQHRHLRHRGVVGPAAPAGPSATTMPGCSSPRWWPSIWLLVLQRRRPRTDLLRAGVILWSVWLVLTFGFFSGIAVLELVLHGRARSPPSPRCAAWAPRRPGIGDGRRAVRARWPP